MNGKKIAQDVTRSVIEQVKQFPEQPLFCDILVGDDPVSEQYVRMKYKQAERVGIGQVQAVYPETITTDELVEKVHELNQTKNLAGLIVQLPLPEHIDTQRVLDAIDPAIDVDVLGTTNQELFYTGTPKFLYPTAAAVMRMLGEIPIDLAGKRIVVVGQGKLVGKPVTFLLEQQGYNVTPVTRSTENPEQIFANADVIITAAGQENLLTGEMVKEGVIVIDAGTSEANNAVVGDVQTETVAPKAAYLSAVPGGVGPITVAELLNNVVEAFKQKVDL